MGSQMRVRGGIPGTIIDAIDNARQPLAPFIQHALEAVAEVITVAPSDDEQPTARPPSAAPADASRPSFEPPLPPPGDPLAVSVGQTIDQVVAVLGKPLKTARVGTEDIYYYKDIKVTFVNGKMTDAQ